MKYLLSMVLGLSLVAGSLTAFLPTAPQSCCKPDSCSCSCETLLSEVVAPYVEIQSHEGRCIGAGTVISYNGHVYVLTAGHVADAVLTHVEGEKYPHMQLKKEAEEGHVAHTWDSVIKAIKFDDEGWDLAVLEPRNLEGLTPAYFCPEPRLERAEDAFYIGTPGGLHAMLEKTIINRPVVWDSYDRDFPRTVVNGNGWYGNSGGGLFVKRAGHYVLVGVIVELARSGEKSPLMAVPADKIQEFLDSL